MENITFIKKIKLFIIAHKFWSIVILLAVIISSYYLFFKGTTTVETRYVTTSVEKGSIVTSVSGSGQVSSTNQVDLKSKVSGDIVYLGVVSGQKVSIGTLIAKVDAKDVEKSVRDAEISLANAKLSLKTAQTQNNNTDINQEISVKNTYNNLLNSSLVAEPSDSSNLNTNTYLSAPIISGNYILGKEGKINIHFYSSTGGTSFNISGLTNGSSIGNTSFATPIGDSGLYLTLPTGFNLNNNTDWVINIPNKSSSNYRSNYDSYQSALNNQEQTNSTSDVNLLNIEAKRLSIIQAENSLQDAKDKLSDYFIRATFEGTIASILIQKSESVSNNTVIGTLITKQKVSTISLNEVDIAKIKLDQKAVLTFDAIEDLTVTGKVYEIDSIGSVSQGVVSYKVSISHDIDDIRVKPGMSVSASIINDTAQDVLVVPSSAIKNLNGLNYVEVFNEPLSAPVVGTQGSISSILPTQVQVEIGLEDDTSTEIISGLKEGDIIVTKKTTSSVKKTTTTSAPSILGAVGGTGTRTGGGPGSLR